MERKIFFCKGYYMAKSKTFVYLSPFRRREVNTGGRFKPPAEIAHLVEHQLPKLRVAGSSPVFRSGMTKAS